MRGSFSRWSPSAALLLRAACTRHMAARFRGAARDGRLVVDGLRGRVQRAICGGNTPIAQRADQQHRERGTTLTDSPLSRTTPRPATPSPRRRPAGRLRVRNEPRALPAAQRGTADTAEPAFTYSPSPRCKPAAKVCSAHCFFLSPVYGIGSHAIFSAVCPMPTVIRPVLDAPLRGRAPRQFYTWPKIRRF